LLNLRMTAFEDLVDLGRIEELRGIERRGDRLWIGAATTQAAVERSTEVADAVPLLARAMPLIGHFQIRNRGTVGGSLAHADPAAEIPAVALALDATLEARSPSGARTIAAADFFTGFWSTALGDDEVLTGVSFPVRSARSGFAVEEVARRHGDFAIAGAAVALEPADDHTVGRVAIALFGLGSTPERATVAEASITGSTIADLDPAAVGRAAVADLTAVPSDLNGSADYRRRVGATVVARALTRAVEEASDG
jgi:carbon-monoxide dehydrogenase medium subunit